MTNVEMKIEELFETIEENKNNIETVEKYIYEFNEKKYRTDIFETVYKKYMGNFLSFSIILSLSEVCGGNLICFTYAIKNKYKISFSKHFCDRFSIKNNYTGKKAYDFCKLYSLPEGEYHFSMFTSGAIYVSDKQTCKKIKGGKFIKNVFKVIKEECFHLSESDILDKLRSDMRPINHMIKIRGVNEVYNSSNLKISSCMIDKDMSLLDEMGVKCLVVEEKGNIIARCLIYKDLYFGRIYATNVSLENKLKGYLKAFYKPAKKDTEPLKLDFKGNLEQRYFIPYMDYYQYLIETDNGYQFYNNSPEDTKYRVARNTNGIFS